MKESKKARRKRDKAARKLALDRDRLAALEVGGSAERPLVVESSALVEIRARAAGCHQCGGATTLDRHAVTVVDGEPLRDVTLTCKTCHATRRLWFRIQPSLPS